MEALFTKDYMLLWAFVLALALFFPVRRLIWVIYVRRAARKSEPDEAERERLRRRAGATAALICFVFAFLYTAQLFGNAP
jgi:hypothetical protein